MLGSFNFLGQVAVTAGIDFGAAFFLNALLDLEWNFSTTAHWHTIVLFAAILVLHGVLNQFGVPVALLKNVSVWWRIIGVLLIVGVLAFAPSHHQSASYVFTHFTPFANGSGWGSKVYVLLLGLLLAQYTFTGYNASAHMTEASRDAATAGPRGIVTSIVVSLFAGGGGRAGFARLGRPGGARPERPPAGRNREASRRENVGAP